MRAVRIEAGARGDADADAVGLELLCAREACERDLGFGERERAEIRIAQQVGRDTVDERSLPRGELDVTRLAILADALEDAGCTDEVILNHLRSPGPHIRGCFVLDLLLDKR